MAPNASRPRSTTSVSNASTRPRPLSRASTSSVHTTIDPSIQGTRNSLQRSFSQSYMPQQSGSVSVSPEEMISRSECQLKNPDQNPKVDGSYHPDDPHSRAMSVDTAYSGNQDTFPVHLTHSYTHDGQSAHDLASMNDKGQQNEPARVKKPKGGASNVANEQELRRLFREHCHRDLRDVAISVLANERGPKSEKTKQIFAMNW